MDGLKEQDKPYYVLKACEGVRMPKNDTPALYYFKKVTGWMILMTAAGALFFRGSPYRWMSIAALPLLIWLYVRGREASKEEFVPSPFEIRFYTDYMVIYREKLYYHMKLSRKQYDKFYYKDIRKCLYHKASQRMEIYGIVEGVWYDYNKDGMVPGMPTYHKTADSFCYFYTNMEPGIDFAAELEKRVPVRVAVRD